MKSDVGLQRRPPAVPLSGKTNPFDMETAEQLLEKLNRQFRAGEPAAVLLRTLTALESSIRHRPPAVRLPEPDLPPLRQPLPPVLQDTPEPPSDAVIEVLEVDEAEIEEELRALKEAAELRQVRQQHLRPDLTQLSEDEPAPLIPQRPPAIDPAQVRPAPPVIAQQLPQPLQAPVSGSIKPDQKELNETMADLSSSLNDRFRNSEVTEDRPRFLEPITDLKTAIGINDRFRFVNELFAGDNEAFSRSIRDINQAGDRTEALRILEADISRVGCWRSDHPALRELIQLVERRYP